MIKAKVRNLFSEFSFIKDFQQLQVFQEENGDLEGKYRLSELGMKPPILFPLSLSF